MCYRKPSFMDIWYKMVVWLRICDEFVQFSTRTLLRHSETFKISNCYMTRCRVVKMIIFSWTIPIIFVVGLLLILSSISAMVFVNIFTMLVEFFSCSLLTFCTASIIRVVYKQDRAAPSLGKVRRFNQHREKSAIVMMTIVVVVFLICYGVYFRCSFAALFLNITCNDFSYKIPLFILNSAINPWAYALFKRDIKAMIKRLFCRASSSHSVTPFILANRSAVGSRTL